QDVFVRDMPAGDLQAGTTTLVSVRATPTPTDASGYGASSSPVLSADGHYVAFVSNASDLVAGDVNGVQDVFVRDLQPGGTTTLASVSTTGAIGNKQSWGPALSADGH